MMQETDMKHDVGLVNAAVPTRVTIYTQYLFMHCYICQYCLYRPYWLFLIELTWLCN